MKRALLKRPQGAGEMPLGSACCTARGPESDPQNPDRKHRCGAVCSDPGGGSTCLREAAGREAGDP